MPADYGLVATELADLRTILDDAGLDRVALVGHSTGGAIAVAFARALPERVERMALVEPTLLSLLDETDYQRVLASFEPARRAGRGGDDLTGLWNLLEVMGATTWAGLPDESRQRAFTALQPVAPLVGQHIRALFEFELSRGRGLRPGAAGAARVRGRHRLLRAPDRRAAGGAPTRLAAGPRRGRRPQLPR